MKISAVQQPPVYLDLERTMERAIDLVAQAAADGCRMIVFPEAWFPGYPTFVWRFSPGADMGKTDDLYARLLANSIDRSKGGLAPLQEAAKEHAVGSR
jgi:nitrilase